MVPPFLSTPCKWQNNSQRTWSNQTVRAVKEIAASCGFSSSEIMRRTFLSQLQVTPSAYRLRFQRRNPSRTSLRDRQTFRSESFPNFGRGFVDRSVRREGTDRNDIIYTELENWDIHFGPFWTPIANYPEAFQYVGEVRRWVRFPSPAPDSLETNHLRKT
jgi:Bacterial regulatory helix-turn-helix proteins, AraC family